MSRNCNSIKEDCVIYETTTPAFVDHSHATDINNASVSHPAAEPDDIISIHGLQILSDLFMTNSTGLQCLELIGVLPAVSTKQQLFKFCAIVNDFFDFARDEISFKKVILRDVMFRECYKADLVRECQRCHIAVDGGESECPLYKHSSQEPWLILSQGNACITIGNVQDC